MGEAEFALGRKALGSVSGKTAEGAPGIASASAEVLTQAKDLGEIAFGKLIAGRVQEAWDDIDIFLK